MAKVQIEKVVIVSLDELEFEVVMDALRERDKGNNDRGSANHASRLMYEILDGISTAEGH